MRRLTKRGAVHEPYRSHLLGTGRLVTNFNVNDMRCFAVNVAMQDQMSIKSLEARRRRLGHPADMPRQRLSQHQSRLRESRE